MEAEALNTDQQTCPPLRPLRHLVRGVWIQLLRRHELYTIVILLGLYVVGALILRIIGIESPQTARFIAGLGLQLGSLLAALLVLIMGARQMPVEIELRTIYPILAKPVTRGQVLLGKALPTWGAGSLSLILFTLATLAITPRLPYQHALVLAEALALQIGALAMLTLLAIWASLWLPVGLAVLGAGLIYFAGGVAGNMLIQFTQGAIAVKAACGLIPDFALLDQFSRYVDGGAPLGGGMMLGLMAYAAIWTAVLGALAAIRFRRMML